MRKKTMNDNTWMYAEMPALILKNKTVPLRLIEAGSRLFARLMRAVFHEK